jgi:hypothetical protein
VPWVYQPKGKGREMRRIWDHQPPERYQPEPEDNGHGHVMGQVQRWHRNQTVFALRIHPESAMEIASWWQTPNNGFAVFASTGAIPDGFVAEIEAEIRAVRGDEYTPVAENRQALEALLAYVKAARPA